MKRILSFLHILILFINIVAIIALFLSYSSPYISPVIFWPIAFLGLAYPFILALNILFVIYWIILFKKYFIYSLLTVLMGWNYMADIIQINLNENQHLAYTNDNRPKDFSILSYNVRTFNAYGWSNGGRETKKKIFKLIHDVNADVLCIQEFTTFFEKDKKGLYDLYNLDTLLAIQPAKNYHYEETFVFEGISHFGIITFSKYPILQKGTIIFPNSKNNRCIYTDIKIDDDTIRIYNMHLQSIHFKYKDYEVIDSIKQRKQIHFQQIGEILGRLKNAYIDRAMQAEIVAEHIKQSPHPTIVCGDFNDTPISYAYHTISKDLNDAFITDGEGLGTTYTGKFPAFRIDYMLYTSDFDILQYKIIHEELSDHFPVKTILKIKNHNQ
ncbi:endonuclease/exonuclease/phosphatase family protein [Candidatus Amoebophilus asiaticus]|nr:endonuclease/exonuclease/phosphatase family protein [Candidatus Amoebophilus asiaticus]